MAKLVAGAQGRSQGGEVHTPEDGADAASPAVDAGGADLPELPTYGIDQLTHNDPGLLDLRLGKNPEGGGHRYRGTRGSGRGHEARPHLSSAMSLPVMIRRQVSAGEVLRDPLGQVARRKVGEDPARDRSQVT